MKGRLLYSINLLEMRKKKTKHSKQSRIFFTSDLWLGRNNIIDIFGRPFGSVREMDERIIENWNTTVGDEDIVFVLGNFVYDGTRAQNIISDLRGVKIFMMSESDKNILRIDDVYMDELTLLSDIYMNDAFKDDTDHFVYENFGMLTSEEILNYIERISEKYKPNVIILKNSIIDLARYGIVLSLYPLLEWNGKESGTLNLHGGVADSSKNLNEENRISVRTDFWGFRPIELSEIQTLVSQLKN